MKISLERNGSAIFKIVTDQNRKEDDKRPNFAVETKLKSIKYKKLNTSNPNEKQLYTL